MTSHPSPGLRLVSNADAASPLRQLYERYGASVYGRCVYLLRDRSQAEDAMQDVFARALESWNGFRAEASPLTWLMTIATNHCLNLLRAQRAGWRERFTREEKARGEADPRQPGPQALEARELVRRMLGRFDPETQAAAVHYHVDEMTLDEVAAALGRSVPTVRKRLEHFASVCGKEFGP
jgi:RNA polymerase sigma-70 factor (ECF subfamily)